MRRIKQFFTNALVGTLLVFLAAMNPGTALADTTPTPIPTTTSSTPSPSTTSPTTTTQSAPSSSSSAPSTTPSTSSTSQTATGPQQPTGADASTYHYNSATGMWENDYYIWNPATGQAQPKTPQTYSYNPATGHWDTTKWVYDTSSGTYKPNTVSVTQPPAGAPTTDPAATAAATMAPTPNSSTDPPNGNNSTTDKNQSSGTFDLFYNASISNTLNSTATSGNAGVINNTLGGNAASGNATAIATIANLLQSSTNFTDPGKAVIFTSNIQGNVTGDFLIDPDALAKQLHTSSTVMPTNLTLNASGNGQISNNINLAAASGNATVAGNTTGGNAASGNANAVANVVNVLNSAINAGKSFIGTVNIYGNLNGDILLPPGLLSALLASNASSSSAPGSTRATNTVIDSTNTQSINNQIATATTTGHATVNHNTTAGNAMSGNALSNITILNLTGSNVIGSNDMLVFVNVLGKWVGAIVHAPTGATAAELGSGVTTNTVSLPKNTTITTTNNNQINNNITLTATSGNAAVTDNTTGGDATTGNATTSANLLNIISSNLSMSNWFGILFINVFGTWYGSFGVNTSAGNPVAHPSSPSGHTTPSKTTVPTQVFQFTPRSSQQSEPRFTLASSTTNITPPSITQPSSSLSSQQPAHSVAAVLGSHTTTPPATDTPHSFSVNYWIPIIGLAIGASLFITERALSRREHQEEREHPPIF